MKNCECLAKRHSNLAQPAGKIKAELFTLHFLRLSRCTLYASIPQGRQAFGKGNSAPSVLPAIHLTRPGTSSSPIRPTPSMPKKLLPRPLTAPQNLAWPTLFHHQIQTKSRPTAAFSSAQHTPPPSGSKVRRSLQRTAMTDAARCDGQCTALRWTMQRTAPSDRKHRHGVESAEGHGTEEQKQEDPPQWAGLGCRLCEGWLSLFSSQVTHDVVGRLGLVVAVEEQWEVVGTEP